jgi:hypothetical protein
MEGLRELPPMPVYGSRGTLLLRECRWKMKLTWPLRGLPVYTVMVRFWQQQQQQQQWWWGGGSRQLVMHLE